VNQQPRIPSYRLHKPSGQAIVVIRGKTLYLGRFGSLESHAEYNRIIAEWVAQGTAAPTPPNSDAKSDLRISELILAYWCHVETYYVKDGQPTTEAGVIRQAIKVVRELYGHTPAKDFGPLSLRACQDAMIAKGWSRESINRQSIRIRAMFKWAASRELLPAAIFQALQTVEGLRKGRSSAKERPPVLPVPDNIVEKTLAHLPDVPAAMVRLQRLTGMRPQEVVELRSVDIDMTDPTCWVFRPHRHKCEHHDRERVVFIGPKAIEVLKPFIGLDISGYVFSPRRSEAQRNAERREARKTPLYGSHVTHQVKKETTRPRRTLGDRYSVGTYRQAIHRGCDAAFPHPTLAPLAIKDLSPGDRERYRELRWSSRDRSLPLEHRQQIKAAMDDLLMPREQRTQLEAWQKAHHWHPNRLRHSAATRLRREFGLDVAKAVLGHSSVMPTQVYAEQDQAAAADAMRRIG
jgi:integrase